MRILVLALVVSLSGCSHLENGYSQLKDYVVNSDKLNRQAWHECWHGQFRVRDVVYCNPPFYRNEEEKKMLGL